MKKLLILCFFVCINISLFAWNPSLKIHDVASSSDGEWNAASIYNGETKEESVWVYRTHAHWDVPFELKKFNLQNGWALPSVCYDKVSKSFIVYHHCWLSENNDGGIYEFLYKNGKYSSKNYYLTPVNQHPIGISKLIANDCGIYLLGTYGEWTGKEDRNSKLFKLKRDGEKLNLVLPDNLINLEFAHLGWRNEKLEYKDNCLRDIIFVTETGLIILDADEVHWNYYDCITEKLTKFDSKEAAIAYDENLKTKKKQDNKIIIVLIILCSVLINALLGLIGAFCFKRKKSVSIQDLDLKDKNRFIFEIQETERSKISRDIHDSVIQDIRVIRLETENLDVIESSMEQQNRIKKLATECIVKLRNICYNLAPAELSNHTDGDSSEIELVSIINTLAQQFSSRTHVPCSVTVEENFKYPVFEKEITQNIFRVVQEALTNIEKHSYATQVSIFFKTENTEGKENIVIYITDDGIGISSERLLEKMKGKEHMGLRSMRDRMNLVGGTIEFVSDQDCGMEVIIRI